MQTFIHVIGLIYVRGAIQAQMSLYLTSQTHPDHADAIFSYSGWNVQLYQVNDDPLKDTP